jgi:hypothetical protein
LSTEHQWPRLLTRYCSRPEAQAKARLEAELSDAARAGNGTTIGTALVPRLAATIIVT